MSSGVVVQSVYGIGSVQNLSVTLMRFAAAQHANCCAGQLAQCVCHETLCVCPEGVLFVRPKHVSLCHEQRDLAWPPIEDFRKRQLTS